jgi:hypothetical protein
VQRFCIINRGHGSRFNDRFALSFIFLWQICWTDLYDFGARQFCRLISQQRLRPVTLRPTLSDGLPFSSSIKNQRNGYAK